MTRRRLHPTCRKPSSASIQAWVCYHHHVRGLDCFLLGGLHGRVIVEDLALDTEANGVAGVEVEVRPIHVPYPRLFHAVTASSADGSSISIQTSALKNHLWLDVDIVKEAHVDADPGLAARLHLAGQVFAHKRAKDHHPELHCPLVQSGRVRSTVHMGGPIAVANHGVAHLRQVVDAHAQPDLPHDLVCVARIDLVCDGARGGLGEGGGRQLHNVGQARQLEHAGGEMAFRAAEKRFRRCDEAEAVDPRRQMDGVRRVRIAEERMQAAFAGVCEAHEGCGIAFDAMEGKVTCSHPTNAPGLTVYPNLLPLHIQRHLLHVIHAELQREDKNTNLILLHDKLTPHFAHGSISKKVRWVTLGQVYDWTDKVYTSRSTGVPPFLAQLVHELAGIAPEAGIVNFYSPGDSLSGHVDLSEACNAPLVSISMGLDAIFLVAKSKDEDPLALHLRSGDVVVMEGDARFAVHGVPRVFGTWPEELCDAFHSRRININMRQVNPLS